MNTLVTGATGLVGSHIVRALLQHGDRVRALVRHDSDCSALAGLPVERCAGDVLKPDSLVAAASGCDIVFHAAADFTYWGKSTEQLNATALTGTANLLEAAAAVGCARVVVTSSSVVFGYGTSPEVRDENDEPQQESRVPYVDSKIRQDQLAIHKGRELGLDVVVGCPTMVVGPFAVKLGPSNAVITTYLEDPFRFTYPGGCNIVAASDVGHGHVLLGLAGQPGTRYILGGENLEWRTIHVLISELCGTTGPSITASHTACYLAALGEEVKARMLDRAPATTRSQATMVGRYYWYSHDRAAALGFRPKPARESLAIALSWLVASPHVSREARTRLLLSDSVWSARRVLNAMETAIRETA